jgi:hypothetical protein
MHQAFSSGRLVFLLLALVALAAPAHAQKTTVPSSMLTVRRDQPGWSSQLRMAREFGQKTLLGLQNTSTDDGVPIDERVLQSARDTYVLVRVARYGVMEAVRDDRRNDPILQITLQKVEEAWQLARTPVEKAESSAPRQEYLEAAIRDLGRSMRLIDQILVVIP